MDGTVPIFGEGSGPRRGRDMAIVGGPTMVRTFGDPGLIDEYRIWVHRLDVMTS